MTVDYVHGYSQRESTRLEDQADCLTNLLHHDSTFAAGSRILEAGCGVGAQTRIIATKNPDSTVISIDISKDSIGKAEELIASENIPNVEFRVGDIYDPEFPDGYFDHVFICFVLEHLEDPASALKAMRRVLKKGGTVTVIEGDHGSAFFHPDSACARAAIDSQIELQSKNGGNALIGRMLHPLLVESGYERCVVSPRMVYVDSSNPALVEGFIKNTFTAMIEGIRERVTEQGIIDKRTFEQGIGDLYKTCEPNGVFCYTFFRGSGTNP